MSRFATCDIPAGFQNIALASLDNAIADAPNAVCLAPTGIDRNLKPA
jgi:hypothetical protein